MDGAGARPHEHAQRLAESQAQWRSAGDGWDDHIAQFPAFARQHWERIRTQLRDGSYHPAPVRRVFIPKPDGSQRPLGVPTVLDRVIQQAIAQVLTPLYDGEFSDQSYGFRLGRSAHQAVRRVQTAWKQILRHAIDCDLKAFFDTVNHYRLINQLRPKIGSGKLLRLIGRYLRAGVVLPDGTREATPLGVPQGGPLSPLLANITLDPLDKEIERRGHVHARYADDFIILVAGEKKAQRVMESVTRFIERKLKLVVNRTKSKSGPLIESSFLGFCISSRGSIKWTAKAHARFKQKVREITRRNRGHAVQTAIDELRRYAVGWMNYFGISRTYREVLELDDWIRRRVRLYHWKQWKITRTRRRNLIKLGANPEEVHMASRSRKGVPSHPLRPCGAACRLAVSLRSALAHEPQQHRATGPEQPTDEGTRSARTEKIWIKLHHGEAVKSNR